MKLKMSTPVLSHAEKSLHALWDQVHEKCIPINRKCRKNANYTPELQRCDIDYVECIQKEGFTVNHFRALRALQKIADRAE